VLKHVDPEPSAIITSWELEQSLTDARFPNHGSYDKKVKIQLKLFSLKSRQLIYSNIVESRKGSFSFNDKDGDLHLFNFADVKNSYVKAFIKGLKKLQDDCGL
jgi:uncharacterized protein involved in outer membrane biogenesis